MYLKSPLSRVMLPSDLKPEMTSSLFMLMEKSLTNLNTDSDIKMAKLFQEKESKLLAILSISDVIG